LKNNENYTTLLAGQWGSFSYFSVKEDGLCFCRYLPHKNGSQVKIEIFWQFHTLKLPDLKSTAALICTVIAIV
jgi:hypothetical protein